MKIFSLKLRGFIGIKKGMGLDELSLDFSELSGLIALSGENGNGKTTVLDNLSPYRQLASRAGALQRHVFLRDSIKELCFEFAGDNYRTLIKIDSDSDRTEGFVWKNDTPQVSGKVSEYDKYITGLFGSSQLFFSSVFCAQNAEKISDMTTGELKKLFSEFLRLDRLVEFENTAKQCVALLTAKADGLRRDIQAAKDSLAGTDHLSDKLAGTEAAMKESTLLLASLTRDLRTSESELDVARIRAASNASIRQRVMDMENNAMRIEKDIVADTAASETELSALREKARGIMAEIAGAEKLLESKDAIAKAVSKAKDVASAVEANAGRLSDVHQKRILPLTDQMTKASAELAEAKSVLSTVISDPTIRILEAKKNGLSDRLADLEKKDPACTSTTCSFITGALRAKTELEELLHQIEDKKRQVAADTKAIQSIVDTKLAETLDIRDKLSIYTDVRKNLEAEGFRLKAELGGLKAIAADQSKIAVAEARLNDLIQRKEDAITDGKRIRATWDERIDNKRTQLNVIWNETENIRNTVDVLADNKVSDIQSIIASSRSHIEAETKDVARLEAVILSTRKDIEARAATESRISDLALEYDRAVSESADWLYLKNACSKDGLRALEIDSVAPIISGYANDLLVDTFGPQYTVRLRTQDEETGKEVLDVLTIREDGSEVNIENLSGGERVWSLKAMRLAMTLISKEKSGKAFTSFLADEEDGSLDTENAQNFIGLYRSFMKSGGFDTGFFISHKPECVSMADHVLRFGNGGIVIE